MNQEVGNRNVMLHAASANGPREISIGLPGGDVNVLENVFASNDGAMELQFDLQPGNAGRCGVELRNDKGEKTVVYIDADRQRIVMDRAESGITDFGKKVEPHHLDNAASLERYRTLTENYRNAFALGTWAPLEQTRSHRIRVFTDRSSVELFVDGGRVAMTNLVFPTKPYNTLRFFSEGSKARVDGATVYRLSTHAGNK
mgnify:CR=1 FL=1